MNDYTVLSYLVLRTRNEPKLNNLIQYFDIEEINRKDINGNSALMHVCKNYFLSSIETVKLLVKHGADVNIQNDEGFTALMFAACWCTDSTDVIDFLLKYSDVNIQDNDYNTAFMYACKYNTLSSVKLFLEYDININLKNKSQCNAFMFAVAGYSLTYKTFDIIELLLNKGVDINAKDNNGETVFMFVCRHNLQPLIQLFLDWECDVYIKDNDGKYPIEYATKEIIPLILTKMNINLTYEAGSIYDLMVSQNYYKEYVDELNRRHTLQILQTKWYERVIKGIPEQDAKVRYKIGNMGYKICKYYEDKIITEEILHYLSAAPDTLDKLVNDYLGY